LIHLADTTLHHVYSVLPFSTSCLKLARNGSKSDFKNRMFRPITRRWGICFRSTQRYTVCALTPRKCAASRTVIGYSASAECFARTITAVGFLFRVMSIHALCVSTSSQFTVLVDWQSPLGRRQMLLTSPARSRGQGR